MTDRTSAPLAPPAPSSGSIAVRVLAARLAAGDPRPDDAPAAVADLLLRLVVERDEAAARARDAEARAEAVSASSAVAAAYARGFADARDAAARLVSAFSMARAAVDALRPNYRVARGQPTRAAPQQEVNDDDQ